MDLHIFADPVPESQDLKEPKDPNPKHFFTCYHPGFLVLTLKEIASLKYPGFRRNYKVAYSRCAPMYGKCHSLARLYNQ